MGRNWNVSRKKFVGFPFKRLALIHALFLITEPFPLFLIAGHPLLITPLVAKDLGTHGPTFSIEEEDPIALIQQKLKEMEERGELEEHKLTLQKKTKDCVERPKPVEGITKATTNRTFSYDPTYVVKEDIKDHTGKVLYKKGLKFNPLQTLSLTHNLIFFDGDDLQQKAWASGQLQKGPLKLILVKGSPLALSKELGAPVYFDQGGVLTHKLGIKRVPALVTQDGLRLRIEEKALEEKRAVPGTALKEKTL